MTDKPVVRSITPQEASPGDQIEVFGGGFQRGDRVEIWDDVQGRRETTISKYATKWISPQQLRLSLPKKLSGGRKRLAILRDNQVYETAGVITIAPLVSGLVAQKGTKVTIKGRGFTASSQVRIGEMDLVPTEVTPSRLTVTLPSAMPLHEVLSPSVTMPEVAPVARSRSVTPITLSSDFRVGRDGFSFANDVEYQIASWGTFVETFGADQVKRANRLSTFLFLWAYYALYTSFFEGTGVFQASGLCSGLAASSLERFCRRALPATYELQPTLEIRRELTVMMGKILGREVLTLAYEQCRRGLANVSQTVNQIQSSLQTGLTVEAAQLLWFLPSGNITQKRFLEQLSNAHSVVPFGLTFSEQGNIRRWRIRIYDVNMPGEDEAWVDVEQRDSEWSWQHNLDGRFSAQQAMTLAAIPVQLFLKPAEFPFSGPFGLTGFLFDMLF